MPFAVFAVAFPLDLAVCLIVRLEASVDATTALYQALAATEEDFAAFGVQLRRFGDPLPQTPSAPAPAPGEPVRSKAVAQPVAKRSRPASQPPAAEPVHRLRRPARDRRSVSQELADALNRLDQK